MIDSDSQPTIIDALAAPLQPMVFRRIPWLDAVCEAAQAWRKSGLKPNWRAFDDVDNDAL